MVGSCNGRLQNSVERGWISEESQESLSEQNTETHGSSSINSLHNTVQFSEVRTTRILFETSKTQGTSSNFNKAVSCTCILLIWNSNLHMSQRSCITCMANRRKKGSTKKWPATRKMSDEEIETKKAYKLQLPHRQEPTSLLLGNVEEFHLKVPLGEVENAVRCCNV